MIFLLKESGGLTQREIASYCGIGPTAVSMSITRLRTRAQRQPELWAEILALQKKLARCVNCEDLTPLPDNAAL
jgi:predicted transcriptional regulator